MAVVIRRLLGVAACLAATLTFAYRAEPARSTMSAAAERYLNEALDLIATRAVDRHRVDWTAQRRESMRAAAGATTTAQTYPAIRLAIAALGNPHSMLITPQSVPAFAGAAGPGASPIGQAMGPDLGYLLVPGMVGPEDAVLSYARTGAAALAELDATAPCGWILDLRQNSGGNMWPMLAVVAPLLGDGTFGYFEDADQRRVGWGIRDGVPLIDGRALYPSLRNGYRLRRAEPPVALLTGPRTASAAEATLIAFEGRPGTRVFGQPTAGLASANQGFPLSDGATLLLTTGNDVDRLGRVYGNLPIPPDEPAASGLPDDPALQAASTWLRRQPACRTVHARYTR